MRTTTPLRVVAGVSWRGEQILVTQRPPDGRFPLEWEFPGGKIERGETPEHALAREIREELGVEGSAVRTLATHRHDYAGGLQVEIVFMECTLASHDFTPSTAVHATRWAAPADIDPLQMLEGDRPFLADLVRGKFRSEARSR